MSERSARRWYAIHVRPRCEKKVAALLGARGLESFLPLYPRRRQWSDRSKVVEFPLFPQYTFAHLAPDEQGVVTRLAGVRALVSFGARAIPVEDDEMESVRKVVAAGLGVTRHAQLLEGQRVRVEHGPLAGCEGVLERYTGGHRLVVGVSILRRSVAVEVDPSWVTVIPGPKAAAVRRMERGRPADRLRRGVF